MKAVGQLLVGLLLLAGLLGCESQPTSQGPPSIRHDSRAVASLEERIRRVEMYVNFRRHYVELDYDLFYNDNGGGLPGPSDWDIRLLARVPAEELKEWTPAENKPVEMALPLWVKELPGKIPRDGLRQWYVAKGVEIGIDPKAHIVAYRASTN